MPINQIPRPGNKKQELLARRQTILNNLKYYEKRIREELLAASSVVFDDSSDSDSDLLPCQINSGPTISELKDKKEMLEVGLNATCELACLEVLQSEVHVMTEDPVIKGEAPVLKPGLWREVTAECRIGTVPFSITFHVHQAAGPFGAKSYRNLQVLPVKTSHEVELSKSVLPNVKCPSNSIEVLRSYSVAHRSRRSTLGRLADKYAGSLFMEPMAEGGFKLKCANLLELSWVLENNKSPLAPFHHKMIFDLEYMDESYIKIIRQAHKQLSDPTIDTDDRTLLLAQIFDTCLEAEGATQESMDSEVESVKKVDKRRTTLETEETAPKKTKNDQNIDENDENVMQDDNTNFSNGASGPGNNKNNKKDDNQIMAPPKSLPKKVKSKGEENMIQNKKAVKRSSIEENNGSAKKPKFDKNNTTNLRDDEKNKLSNNKENIQANKSAKTKNVKDKIAKAQNNAEKEATNDRVKIVKSKSKEIIEVTKTGNNQNDDVDVQKKNSTNKKVQEIPKKQVNKGVEAQKEEEKEMNQATDKVKMLKSKSKKTIDVAERSYNQNANGKEIQTKENVKKGQEIAKHQVVNKGVESQKKAEKEITKATDKVKVVTSKSKETIDVTKSGNNQNDNKIKKKVNVKKMQEKTEKQINKGSELQNVVEKSKKITNTKNINKVASTDNVAKSKKYDAKSQPIDKKVTSKPNTKNFDKNENSGKNDPTSTEPVKEKNNSDNGIQKLTNLKNQQAVNDKPKDDKIILKTETPNNKKGSENAIVVKDITNKKGISVNNKITKDGKNQNSIEKEADSIYPFDQQKIISSTPKGAKSSANLCKSGKVSEAKINNVASKNRDHKAKIATYKNVFTKTGNDKPKLIADKFTKMALKNFSHKDSKNKLPKIITGNIKTIKPTNVGNDFKTGNSSKDSNGSKISKIPQKLGITEKLRRNSLRISPRRLPSTFKSTSDSSVKLKLNQITNIPRLMKKL